MGKLVLPKHSSDREDFITALSIYYQHDDWVANSIFIDELKQVIGEGEYRSSYNKKSQLPKYFGFVTVKKCSEGICQKITSLGKMLFEAIKDDNQEKINEAFMISFETASFGRNNNGSPSSDSDVEMPNVALNAILDLGAISYKELAFLLTKLDLKEHSYDDAINIIKEARVSQDLNFADENKYSDNKPLMLLVNLGFLDIELEQVIGKGKYITLSPLVKNKFYNAIRDLRMFNNTSSQMIADITDELEETLQQIDESVRVTGGENILFYGVPGSGKSHSIDAAYGKQNMTRVVFHPDYMNTDFIGQILPTIKEDKTITYEFTPGPFTKVMEKAYKDPTNQYYLVIEEINRGNAPAIFGEIFQLLDRQDDGESKYAVVNYQVANAMYGDENRPVKIPSNLTFLATMNTSDQNVFTLDTAFQRRWNMRMIVNNIEGAEHKDVNIADTSVTWGAFNTVINNLVLTSNSAMISSEDKRLGAYFVSPADLNRDDIDRRFSEKVIKYLWDDAFKFSRDKVFDSEYKSLESIILHFINNVGDERFDIFKDEIKKQLLEESKTSSATLESSDSTAELEEQQNEQ